MAIETYHRNLKQFAGVEAGRFHLGVTQHNRIGLAVRVLVRLEYQRILASIPIFEANNAIIRECAGRKLDPGENRVAASLFDLEAKRKTPQK